MAEFNIDGRMRVDSLQAQFKEAFGGTLRVYYHHHFAEASARLSEIRSENAPATGELKVNGNMQVGTFEEKMMEQFGIEVQVADANNEVLIENGATLRNAANAKAKAAYQQQDYSREYWVETSCEQNVVLSEHVIDLLNECTGKKYEPVFRQVYIGIKFDDKPCNFITLTPQKRELLLSISVAESAKHQEIFDKYFDGDVKYNKGVYQLKINTEDTEKKGGFFKKLLGKAASNIDQLKPILLQAEKEYRK